MTLGEGFGVSIPPLRLLGQKMKLNPTESHLSFEICPTAVPATYRHVAQRAVMSSLRYNLEQSMYQVKNTFY